MRKKKLRMSLHWFNEYDRKDCDQCRLVNQCKATFTLGVEEFDYEKKTGKLIQRGYRYKTDSCYQEIANEHIDHLNFFYRYKTFGMPYKVGWLELPKRLFRILEICEEESHYMRRKNG